MPRKKSKKFQVDWNDIKQGFLAALIVGTATGLIEILETRSITAANLVDVLVAGLISGLVWVLKNFLQNSQGSITKSEPKQPVK